MTVTIEKVKNFFGSNDNIPSQLKCKYGENLENFEEKNFELVNKSFDISEPEEEQVLHDLQEDVYYKSCGWDYKACRICGRLTNPEDIHLIIDTENNKVLNDGACELCSWFSRDYEPVALLKDEYKQYDQKNSSNPESYVMLPSPSVKKIAYGSNNVKYGSIDTNHPERYNCDISVLKEAGVTNLNDFCNYSVLYIPARDKVVNAVFGRRTYQIFEETAKKYCKKIDGTYYYVVDYLKKIGYFTCDSKQISRIIPSSKKELLTVEDIIESKNETYIRLYNKNYGCNTRRFASDKDNYKKRQKYVYYNSNLTEMYKCENCGEIFTWDELNPLGVSGEVRYVCDDCKKSLNHAGCAEK